MEKLKVKHDHTLTDILKVLIFTLMLLLPGICFIPNALYYGFNEHATNNTTPTINYKYQSNEVNSQSDLHIGNIYTLWGDGLTISDIIGNKNIKFELLNDLYFEDTQSLVLDYFDSRYINKISKNTILMFDDTEYIYFYDSINSLENGNNYKTMYYAQGYFASDLVILLLDNTTVSYEKFAYTDYNEIESVTINTENSISNEMYQAWENLWQTPLFNWTNTTPFNTGLNNFIGVFGITQNSYLANCLIYILSITAIYVVFDIVLAMFKWLTHLIGAK